MNLMIHEPLSAAPAMTWGPEEHDPQNLQWYPSLVELPENLRTWFCDLTLVAWIRQELLNIQGQDQSLCVQKDNLAVLAFSLMSCIFGSDEIARACHSDPALRQLCNGRPPFPHELLSSRRRNRQALQRLLTAVFTRAILCKFGLTSTLLPLELKEDLLNHATDRLDLARHFDQCE